MSYQVKTRRLTLVTVRVHLHRRIQVSRQRSLVWVEVGVHLCAQKHMVRRGTNPRDEGPPTRHHIHACFSDLDLVGWILASLLFPLFVTPCLDWRATPKLCTVNHTVRYLSPDFSSRKLC